MPSDCQSPENESNPPFGECTVRTYPQLLTYIVDEALVVRNENDSSVPDLESFHEGVL
jgi:hypothetical protein